jgi:hypothetical protein
MNHKFVVYSSTDEVIVTTLENDKETYRLYFVEGGREIDDYDREVSTEMCVVIESHVQMRF